MLLDGHAAAFRQRGDKCVVHPKRVYPDFLRETGGKTK
jgi:hypothetical protein